MKTTQPLLILMAIMSLMACESQGKKLNKDTQSYSNTQYPGQIHTITLYVNTTDIVKTESIKKNGKVTNPGLRKYADFRQPYYITNEDFTTTVKKGDIVIWNGISTTDTLDVVNITSINHHGGASFFGRNVLKGNQDVPEAVVGFITKGPEMEDDKLLDTEEYVLYFTVFNKGKKRNGLFHIDPVIKGHQ